jgi:uncharacterized membrane protein YheB (UPF0754 family)
MSERKEFGDPTPEELDKLLASLEEDIELSDMLEEQKQKVLKQEKTKITTSTTVTARRCQNLGKKLSAHTETAANNRLRYGYIITT